MPHIWEVKLEDRSPYHQQGNGMYITIDQSLEGLEEAVLKRIARFKPSEKALAQDSADILLEPPLIESVAYIGVAHFAYLNT